MTLTFWNDFGGNGPLHTRKLFRKENQTALAAHEELYLKLQGSQELWTPIEPFQPLSTHALSLRPYAPTQCSVPREDEVTELQCDEAGETGRTQRQAVK